MRILLVCALSLAMACSASVFQSRDVELEKGGEKTLIRDETGAIIVGKRQVASVRGDRIVNSKGQPLAFLYADYVRLKGGAQLPIKTSAEGDLYIPESAQKEAGLQPMATRVRANGRVASTAGSEGVASKGTASVGKRRLLLVVLLLTANDMW